LNLGQAEARRSPGDRLLSASRPTLARKLGSMKDRVLRDFAVEDIEKIAGTFREWRSSPENSKLKTSNLTSYIDVSGFCKSATLQEIATHGYALTAGRYVGAEDVEDDGDSLVPDGGDWFPAIPVPFSQP
jgi:type I restriction-modification system DNA methylase subunit